MAWTLVTEGLSADGQSTAWDHPGGMLSVAIVGSFSSGTADLQFSPDDGSNYYDVDTTNASLTASGVFNINIADCKLRIDLAGSSSPDIDVFYQTYNVNYGY